MFTKPAAMPNTRPTRLNHGRVPNHRSRRYPPPSPSIVATTRVIPIWATSPTPFQGDGCSGAMRGETLTQAPELVKREHNLSEHATHPRAREAVDGQHADGGDDDEDHAERRRLARAARDLAGEDADGNRFPAADRQEQHGRRLLQRRHEREQRADEHAA